MRAGVKRRAQIQGRDRKVLAFLKEQGFATGNQINRGFYQSLKICSRRLVLMERSGFIESFGLSDYFRARVKSSQSRFFPYLLDLGLNPRSKIYRLSETYRVPHTSTKSLLKTSLVLHQLLLNEARLLIAEALKPKLVLSEPEIKVISPYFPGMREEICPDLCFESEGFRLAVEMERTLKSKSRYLSRMAYFKDSTYTHILYLYASEAHLPYLLECAKLERKVAFSHYRHPDRVLSPMWGYMTLTDFLATRRA